MSGSDLTLLLKENPGDDQVEEINWDSCLPMYDITDKADGTLESIVNQATDHPQLLASAPEDRLTMAMVMAMAEPIVTPSTTTMVTNAYEPLVISANQVDGGVGLSLPVINNNQTNGSTSTSVSATQQVMDDTLHGEIGGTSIPSPENSFHGIDYTKDLNDSISHSKEQRKMAVEDEDREKKLSIQKTILSTKRSRADLHNQSERNRREKINQRMNTLRNTVPNSTQTDKASMLDEVIAYIKKLEDENRMMRREKMMNAPPWMQQLKMYMAAMGMGAMDMNTINCPAVPLVIPPTSVVMPASWGNPSVYSPTPQAAVMPDLSVGLHAYQFQPMTVDTCGRLAAMYQQQPQLHGLNNRNLPMTADAMYQQMQQYPTSEPLL